MVQVDPIASVPCRSRPNLEPVRAGVSRGVALFLGAFSLLNILGEWHHRGFDANLWWIDFRPLPPAPARALLAAAALLLIAYAARPECRRWRRVTTIGVVVFLLGVAVANVVGFGALVCRKAIGAGCPVPFSLLVALALGLVLAGVWTRRLMSAGRFKKVERWAMGLLILGCLIDFPLAQMCCFGLTDYRRPADAVVVFGARLYADGRPSLALADRVRTGCELYRQGLVRKVIFSGGPGDGPIHETEGMRQMALQLGVGPDDILIDPNGLNTRATARNTTALFERHGLTRILVVSHFYHLARIKLTYQRYGWKVYTVPARQTRLLARLPHYMAREIAALWVYYLTPWLPA